MFIKWSNEIVFWIYNLYIQKFLSAHCVPEEHEMSGNSGFPNKNSAHYVLRRMKMSVKIIGTGFYVPENVVTNEDLEKLVDTSDEWIVKRVGVRKRHISIYETASDMASEAAKKALENSNTKPEEIDLIIAATISGETVCPTVSGAVQKAIGAKCPTFDISSACSGFLFAMDTAVSYVV